MPLSLYQTRLVQNDIADRAQSRGKQRPAENAEYDVERAGTQRRHHGDHRKEEHPRS